MSEQKYATLVAKLLKVVKHLETAQFSHGNFFDGNWAANEAASLVKKAIKEVEEES